MMSMAELSPGERIAVAGGILGRQAGRVRLLRAIARGISAAWNSVSRVLRRIWHEATGLVFLLFVLAGASAAIREYQRYTASPSRYTGERVAAAVVFSLLFAWFALTSFLRAKQAGSKGKRS